jgi:PHD/YefM family antitoxin component YafN of YafNO toxin-antitoxin module
MSILTDQQREELKLREGSPVAVLDEQSQKVYYLISAEEFDKVRALLVEEEFQPRQWYPLIAKTAAEAGWSDAAMDAYDHYDEQRNEG